MTSPATAEDTRVELPRMLEHQRPVRDHGARFKVLNEGRRWGKDRLALNVAFFGHGPRIDGQRQWAGIAAGWDVVWLGPDFPQTRGIWLEEIRPRFKGVPGIDVTESPFYSVGIPDVGNLHVRSAEAIDSLRGLGGRLKGVIINEAAHMDLAEAWRRVLRPLLMDNEGWAIFMSTPNRGTDGGMDESGSRRVPSYFNTLCEEIRAGKRGDDWAYFTGDARQNPTIAATEFDALVAEYPPDSLDLQEEVFALLMPPGTGLAFAEWRDRIHVIDRHDLPDHWNLGGGFDWGYWQPSVLVLVAQDERGVGVVFQERRWTQTVGYKIGQEIAAACKPLPRPVLYIAADSSIWGVQGQKGFPNLAEEIQRGIFDGWGGPQGAPVLYAVPKGKDSRIARAQLLHRYLTWEDAGDGTPTPHGQPALRFFRDCTVCTGTLPKLPPDPKRPEDVDTTADDHAYDALTYYLMTRPQPAEAPKAAVDRDAHPGTDYTTGERYKRFFVEEPEPGFLPGDHTEEIGAL